MGEAHFIEIHISIYADKNSSRAESVCLSAQSWIRFTTAIEKQLIHSRKLMQLIIINREFYNSNCIKIEMHLEKCPTRIICLALRERDVIESIRCRDSVAALLKRIDGSPSPFHVKYANILFFIHLVIDALLWKFILIYCIYHNVKMQHVVDSMGTNLFVYVLISHLFIQYRQ